VGRTVTGQPVGLATDTAARLALVGVPDSGKTTACRRLIRRWQRVERAAVGVLTVRPEQYLDLAVDRIPAHRADRMQRPYGLVVVDEADLLSASVMAAAWRGPHRVVVVAGWGSHLPALRAARPGRPPSVLLVEHRPQPRFLHIADGVRVILDPISPSDIDPVRRRTHLGGILIEDPDLDDLTAAPGDITWPPGAAPAPAQVPA
jgi:hypothetical protein